MLAPRIRSILKSRKPLSYKDYVWVSRSVFVNARTLLTGVLGYLTLLRDGEFGKLSKEQSNVIHSLAKDIKTQIGFVSDAIKLTPEDRKVDFPTKIKILHFEDDVFLRKMYQEYFQISGFDFKGYDSPTTNPVKIVLNENPNIILMDGLMPAIDGIKATKLIKADSRTKEIPILGLDNLGDDFSRRALSAGMIDYVMKSNLTPVELADKIRFILSSGYKDTSSRQIYSPLFNFLLVISFLAQVLVLAIANQQSNASLTVTAIITGTCLFLLLLRMKG